MGCSPPTECLPPCNLHPPRQLAGTGAAAGGSLLVRGPKLRPPPPVPPFTVHPGNLQAQAQQQAAAYGGLQQLFNGTGGTNFVSSLSGSDGLSYDHGRSQCFAPSLDSGLGEPVKQHFVKDPAPLTRTHSPLHACSPRPCDLTTLLNQCRLGAGFLAASDHYVPPPSPHTFSSAQSLATVCDLVALLNVDLGQASSINDPFASPPLLPPYFLVPPRSHWPPSATSSPCSKSAQGSHPLSTTPTLPCSLAAAPPPTPPSSSCWSE